MTNAVNIAGLGAALTVSSNVVNFSSTPTVAGSPIGASAATPTAAGTVYGKTDTSSLTFLGYQAGNSVSSSNGTTAVGYQAGYSNTTASQVSFFGYLSGYSVTGEYNAGFGAYTLNSTTSGTNNTAMGTLSLRSNTTGSNNVAVGMQAAYGLTTKTHNVAIGYQALYNTNEDANTAVGSFSLKTNTTGYYNTAMGYGSLTGLTTGIGNVSVGFQTGSVLTTGSYNIYIGYSTGNTTKTSGVDCIYIGRTITPNNAGVNGEMVINTNGNNATGKGDGTGLITTGGNLYNGLNTSAWQTISDRRLKKNIVDNTEGLDVISQIRVRNFEYKLPEEITELQAQDAVQKSGVQLGVIAQELQEVCSDCVKEESTGVLSVNSDNLTWHMVNAIKDLKALNDTLTARITALEAR